MKKVFVFSILIFAFSGALFAQNANISQRIIGTWVDQKGKTWVFNANGNLTIGSDTRYKYGVTDTMLGITDYDYGNSDASTDIYYISISSDGKTLILNDSDGGGFWLIKK